MIGPISSSVTTLVFDLGGVIVDLAPERTLQAFANLAAKPVGEVLKTYQTAPALLAYETGKINDQEFRQAVREVFHIQAADKEIDSAWNAMLVGIPPEKLTMLTRLKTHFTTLVLSNTNSIHLDYLNNVILKGEQLDAYVHRAHYSHRVGMRKPDREIYEHVLSTHKLLPGQVFFMDDNADNIAAAKALGIEALLIEHPSRVIELFKNYA